MLSDYSKNLSKISHFVVGVAILIAIGLSFFPIFNKPDEDLHYLKAVAVSQGNLICQQSNKTELPFNPIPKEYYDFTQRYNFRTDQLAENNSQIDEDTVNEVHSCVLPFLFYLPTGFSLLLARSVGLNLETGFYLGRILNALIASLILVLSLKKIPPKLKLMSIITFALPMSLFQISSYSKDAFHVALGLYIFNYTLKLFLKREITPKKNFVFVLSLLLFILSRPQYFWFSLLTLLIPVKQQKNKFFKFVLKIGPFLCLTLIFNLLLHFLIDNQMYLSPHNQVVGLDYSHKINPAKQLIMIIRHPEKPIIAVIKSFYFSGWFYFKSLVGMFGWLNQSLPNFVYYLYMLLLGLSSTIASFYENIYSKKRALLVFIVVTLTSINIFSSMYLYATPVGETYIRGVQGRYFLALTPLILFILGYMILITRKWLDQTRSSRQ